MRTTLVLIGALLVGVAAASAQTTVARRPAQRGFIAINGGYQVTKNDFTDGATFEANAENVEFSTSYSVAGGASFDAAGGVMLWRHRLGAGVGVTRFLRSTPTSLTGSVPHPFFFSRARAVSGEVASLTREEFGVHIQVRYLVLSSPRLQVLAFGGPSVFQVKQGVVTTFSWDEDYPYDTATFTTATTSVSEASRTGFNAGVDVGYFFAPQIGVGGTVQFSGAEVDLPAAGDKTKTVKAGGTQVGVGVRIRF